MAILNTKFYKIDKAFTNLPLYAIVYDIDGDTMPSSFSTGDLLEYSKYISKSVTQVTGELADVNFYEGASDAILYIQKVKVSNDVYANVMFRDPRDKTKYRILDHQIATSGETYCYALACLFFAHTISTTTYYLIDPWSFTKLKPWSKTSDNYNLVYSQITKYPTHVTFGSVNIVPTDHSLAVPSYHNNDGIDRLGTWIEGHDPYDTTDPNPGGGDAKPGGGGGDDDIGGDTNPDDGLPTISALDSGLLTAYNPNVGQLQSLGRFLWSDSFNLDSFKKLFNDPFDTLLGLSVVPVKPNTSRTQTIMFGNMDSGVSAPVVSNQWVHKDMGSVALNEVWKGALDYAPSTSVTIYLPFVGMRQLNVNDVMGSTLHLIYKFDVLTGACIAQIYVNHNHQGNKVDGFSWTKDQGLLYEFTGQCAENIPLASQDFTNTIRAAIGGVAVATGAAASIATGNPALGIAGLTVGAANLGMQASTPTVERGGHLSGSASILGYSQPFLIVERPHQCKPSKYYALRGVPSQVYTSKLSNCTNFTQITANNNLHIAGATDTELTELQNLLVAGVYFPNKKR